MSHEERIGVVGGVVGSLVMILLLLPAPVTVQAQQKVKLPSTVCATLDREFKKQTGGKPKATITRKQAGIILHATALAHKDLGYGVLGKKGGNVCPLPSPHTETISCDYLVLQYAPGKYRGWDALVDVDPGPASINCGDSDENIGNPIADGSRTFVVAKGTVPDPPPASCPPCEVNDTTISLLKFERDKAIAERDAAIKDRDDARRERDEARTERDKAHAGAESFHQRLLECLQQPRPTAKPTGPGWIISLFRISCETVDPPKPPE